jgi:hypothetical protein
MKINNIKEARDAIAEIGDFLERFNRTLGALGNLTGNLNGQPEMVFVSRVESPAPQKPTLRSAPESMPERILDLLSDSPKAITPKEMEAKYKSLGWPMPADGKLYSKLLATAYYLSKKGKLTNNHGKYSIAIAQNV